MKVEFRLLGGIEAYLDGRRLPTGPPRQRCVLAVLLVEANTAVSTDQLIARVWGDDPPRGARGSVYSYVTRLRRVLDRAAVTITMRSGGYVLTVDPAMIDLHLFHDLVAHARKADDDEQAATLFEQALGLWRGAAFAGQDVPWLNQIRGVLEAERHAAELDRNDAELRTGRHSELIPALAVSAAEHPLDERLAGQLMLALYRAGRQAEALRVYQGTRTALLELGLEPGPELGRLQHSVLAGDPVHPTGEPAAAPRGVVPRQLPAGTAHFSGRAAHLAQLHELAEQPAQAVVITAIDGAAGVGKTALAVHFGHQVGGRYPDGHLYVDLRGYSATPALTPADALRQMLIGLGMSAERIPTEEAELAAAYRTQLADKSMLVVLDNAGSADQVRALLPGNPHCLVVVTSRTTLAAVDGVARLHLDVLSAREAMTLLERLAGPERISREPDAAADLVSLCACLPLAVCIAGARLASRPGWSVSSLVRRLADTSHRLDELTFGDRAVRASFAVSYQVLETSADPVDRAAARAFRLLGVLDWVELSVPVAAALLDQAQPDAHLALERLVDDHLLESTAPGRYRTHDLLRLYAREAGRDEPERDAAFLRAVDCYLATAEQATQLLDASDDRRIPAIPTVSPHGGFALSTKADVHAWAKAERANLLAVAQQAAATELATDRVARLAAPLFHPYESHGYWHDLRTLNALAAAAAHRLGDKSAEAVARGDFGFISLRLGLGDEAIAEVGRALAIRRETGNRRGEQVCLSNLGLAYWQRQRFDDALGCLKEALHISREIGNRIGEAGTLNNLGLVCQRLSQFADAIQYHTQALAIYGEFADNYGKATALANLGWAHYRAGDAEAAIGCYERSLTVAGATGDRYQQAESLWGLGQAQHQVGRSAHARAYWQQSITILHDIGELSAQEVDVRRHQPIPDTPDIIQRST